MFFIICFINILIEAFYNSITEKTAADNHFHYALVLFDLDREN